MLMMIDGIPDRPLYFYPHEISHRDPHHDPYRSGLAQKYAREAPRKPTRYSYPNAPGGPFLFFFFIFWELETGHAAR